MSHKITLVPFTRDGYRGWWQAEVDGDYSGYGSSQSEALCDLVDVMKTELDPYDGKPRG